VPQLRASSAPLAFLLLTVTVPAGHLLASPEPGAPALWPGAFRLLDSATQSDGTWQMRADASDETAYCQFDLSVKFVTSGLASWFKSSTITFYRRPNTDCRNFLATLSRLLKFTGTIPVVAPVQRCGADIIVLADHAERMRGGHGFKPSTSGTWFVSKLVFSDTGSEVYLNLDDANGIGELSLKDEGHAADVVGKFASLFGGSARGF
jgi:hypothetical protein